MRLTLFFYSRLVTNMRLMCLQKSWRRRIERAKQKQEQSRALYTRAAATLDGELADRPLHPDVDAAHALIARWPAAGA